MKKTEPLFYIERAENNAAGPYDLVQMAGLLRKKIITPDTSTRLEGEDDWKPFSWRPQFMVAREMSPDAVSTRAEQLDEEAAVAREPVPLPSLESIIRIVGAVVLLFLVGAITFLLARFDTGLGISLAVIGVAAALVGTCLVYVRMTDESYLTLFMLFFVPFYDIYYFLINFWDYLPYFSMRYVGCVVAAAALAGIASTNSENAEALRSIFHLYGQ